jgi:type II secretory pathway predicted ATPase ExeA
MDIQATFGFHKLPFTRETTIEDAFRLPHLDEACLGLLRTIERRMSATLIAPAGLGKTTLLRRVIAELPDARYSVHYVKVTGLSKRDMCREIATACGAAPAGSYPMLVRRLQERFEQSFTTDGRRPVLVLDEAHDMRPDVLGMVRILTNFAMDSRLVLSVLLAGQPPLGTMLKRDELEDVAQRISYYAALRPLSRDETARYVAHRCTIAGAVSTPFDQKAVDALFEIGRGNLRATDSLACAALEYAAAQGIEVVSHTDVVAVRKNLWPA